MPGGTGGVGSLVVQMAKAAARGWRRRRAAKRKVANCRRLGADLALNYKTEDIPARLREFATDGVDVWYETQREPNLDVAVPLFAQAGSNDLDGGSHGAAGLAAGSVLSAGLLVVGIRHVQCQCRGTDAMREDILRWADEGKLRPIVGRVFPLAEAAEAERFWNKTPSAARGRCREKSCSTLRVIVDNCSVSHEKTVSRNKA